MNRSRTARLLVPFLLICLMGATSVGSAQDIRGGDDVIAITGVRNTSSCENIHLNIFVYNDNPGYFEIRVQTGGEIVTDHLTVTPAAGGSSQYIDTGYRNARGLAPANRWPLTGNKKVTITVTFFNLEFEPTYQTTAVMKNCAATTLKKSWHGPAHQLVQNSSFEAIAHTETVPEPTLAAFWKSVKTVDDARDCGGLLSYAGNCSFVFNANNNVKSKIVQNYNGVIGSAGDSVMLQGFVRSTTGYGGGGQFIAVLRFADGTSRKLKRSFRVGQHLYNYPFSYPYFVTTKLPAPLISAKITVKQGFGSAQAAVDSVTLTVFSKNGAALRALPPEADMPFTDITAG